MRDGFTGERERPGRAGGVSPLSAMGYGCRRGGSRPPLASERRLSFAASHKEPHSLLFICVLLRHLRRNLFPPPDSPFASVLVPPDSPLPRPLRLRADEPAAGGPRSRRAGDVLRGRRGRRGRQRDRRRREAGDRGAEGGRRGADARRSEAPAAQLERDRDGRERDDPVYPPLSARRPPAGADGHPPRSSPGAGRRPRRPGRRPSSSSPLPFWAARPPSWEASARSASRRRRGRRGSGSARRSSIGSELKTRGRAGRREARTWRRCWRGRPPAPRSTRCPRNRSPIRPRASSAIASGRRGPAGWRSRRSPWRRSTRRANATRRGRPPASPSRSSTST